MGLLSAGEGGGFGERFEEVVADCQKVGVHQRPPAVGQLDQTRKGTLLGHHPLVGSCSVSTQENWTAVAWVLH